MAKSQTNASKYKSRMGDFYVTFPQYMAEGFTLKQAKTKGITLTGKFWERPPWKSAFLAQLRHVNALLKALRAEDGPDFAEQAIINAINSKGGKNCYSASAKWFYQIVREEHDKLKTNQFVKDIKTVEQESPTIKEDISHLPTRRPAFTTKNNILDKLRGSSGKSKEDETSK